MAEKADFLPWAILHVSKAAKAQLAFETVAEAKTAFGLFTGNTGLVILGHLAFMLICTAIVYFGVLQLGRRLVREGEGHDARRSEAFGSALPQNLDDSRCEYLCLAGPRARDNLEVAVKTPEGVFL